MAAIQAAAARMLAQPLAEALDADGTKDAYFDIDLPLIGVLAIMERTGASIDCDHLARPRCEYASRARRSERPHLRSGR